MSLFANLVSESPRFGKSIDDIVDGFQKRRIWARLAWMGTREQYQRSVIGPFWITLSTLVMVLTFGLLYGRLMDRELSEHLPYVAVGLVFWMLFSEILVKGCNVFISNGRMIQQLPLPLSIYLYRLVTQELIVFAHNLIIVLVIFLVLLRPLEPVALLSIVGMFLLLVIATSVALIFGVVSTRYRDFPPIVQAFMRPMMFLTPVIWSAEAMPDRAAFVFLNPFHHIIEVCRAPLLGNTPDILSWYVTIALAVFMTILALALFSRYRHRIAYWV